MFESCGLDEQGILWFANLVQYEAQIYIGSVPHAICAVLLNVAIRLGGDNKTLRYSYKHVAVSITSPGAARRYIQLLTTFFHIATRVSGAESAANVG